MNGNAQPVVGPKPVFARQHMKRGRVQAFLQEFRERITDPLDSRRLGLVLEGDDQDGLAGGGSLLARSDGRKAEQYDEPEEFQDTYYSVC